MAKRKRARRSGKGIVVAVVVLVIAATLAWLVASGNWKVVASKVERAFAPDAAPIMVSSAQVDPANEGRAVRIGGALEIGKSPVDSQLGITAKSALLLRHVEMFQWRERCNGSACGYDKFWSATPIDSHRFRDSGGHGNPKFPFTDARFIANKIKIGAFDIDPALLPNASATLSYPVHSSQLPPNLAVTFSDVNGVLYAGGEPTHPQIGSVRISYRIVPAQSMTLTGVQRGSRLTKI